MVLDYLRFSPRFVFAIVPTMTPQHFFFSVEGQFFSPPPLVLFSGCFWQIDADYTLTHFLWDFSSPPPKAPAFCHSVSFPHAPHLFTRHNDGFVPTSLFFYLSVSCLAPLLKTVFSGLSTTFLFFPFGYLPFPHVGFWGGGGRGVWGPGRGARGWGGDTPPGASEPRRRCSGPLWWVFGRGGGGSAEQPTTPFGSAGPGRRGGVRGGGRGGGRVPPFHPAHPVTEWWGGGASVGLGLVGGVALFLCAGRAGELRWGYGRMTDGDGVAPVVWRRVGSGFAAVVGGGFAPWGWGPESRVLPPRCRCCLGHPLPPLGGAGARGRRAAGSCLGRRWSCSWVSSGRRGGRRRRWGGGVPSGVLGGFLLVPPVLQKNPTSTKHHKHKPQHKQLTQKPTPKHKHIKKKKTKNH